MSSKTKRPINTAATAQVPDLHDPKIAGMVKRALKNFPAVTGEEKMKIEADEGLHQAFSAFLVAANVKQKKQMKDLFKQLISFMLSNMNCDIVSVSAKKAK